MTTDSYFGVGRIISADSERVPVRFTRRAGVFINQTRESIIDVRNLRSVFRRAEDLHPGAHNYRPFLNLHVQNKLIADIIAFHNVVKENRAENPTVSREALENQYRKKVLPLSEFYKNHAMTQPEWNILAARWLSAWKPFFTTAMAYSSDDKLENAPRGFVTMDVPNHTLVLDVTSAMSMRQQVVPALYSVDTPSWNAFLDQGRTQERWVEAKRAWRNGTSHNRIFLGFARRVNLGVIPAKLANIKPAAPSQADPRQFQLL